ncbi:MAG: sulfurtransferase TusA family protein [Acidimicrobiia bacterium]|jgi:tRNA 2-thiouridine synthesizing protein A
MSTETTTTEPEVTQLDCSGLLCPLPVYKAAIALDRLQPGDRLRLVTTDPGALEDIPAMTRQRGDELLSVESQEGTQVFTLLKGDSR